MRRAWSPLYATGVCALTPTCEQKDPAVTPDVLGHPTRDATRTRNRLRRPCSAGTVQPHDHEARHDFQGLRYYEPSPDLVFELPVEQADGAEVSVQTSDGQMRQYRRVGVVSFTVGNEGARLTLYSTGHAEFFIPFRDATSGKGSYGAGRYLDVEPNDDGTITLDFNEAVDARAGTIAIEHDNRGAGEVWFGGAVYDDGIGNGRQRRSGLKRKD